MSRGDLSVSNPMWTEQMGEEHLARYDDRPARRGGLPQNVGEVERWGSIAVGSLLTIAGLARGKMSGLALGAIGASLVYRGVTGHCYCYESLGIDTAEHNPATAVPAQEGVKVRKTVAVNCPPEQLYSFWRDVENLPRVMRHLKKVEAIDRQRSHWVAEGPMGMEVAWDAEVYNERENEMIAWRSLPSGDIQTAGSVHFRRMGDRTTAVEVSMKYNPPAGKIGATIASLLGSGLEQEMTEDLNRFKSFMEAGEIPATTGQPPSQGTA